MYQASQQQVLVRDGCCEKRSDATFHRRTTASASQPPTSSSPSSRLPRSPPRPSLAQAGSLCLLAAGEQTRNKRTLWIEKNRDLETSLHVDAALSLARPRPLSPSARCFSQDLPSCPFILESCFVRPARAPPCSPARLPPSRLPLPFSSSHHLRPRSSLSNGPR